MDFINTYAYKLKHLEKRKLIRKNSDVYTSRFLPINFLYFKHKTVFFFHCTPNKKDREIMTLNLKTSEDETQAE